MDIDAVDPRLRRATLRLLDPDPSRRIVILAARIGMRLMPAQRVTGVTLATSRAGRVPLRRYRPVRVGTPAPALLWMHGGGLVLGGAKMDDRFCAETARDLGIVVVSVDYRLAPEHPFPAPLDDVHAAWGWLLDHAGELGIDATRIAIGGQSAGGGLAAALAQRLLDAGGTQPVAQWLFCPMLDDRTAARIELDALQHWAWNNRANRFCWTAYLCSAAGAESVPDHAVAARRADLRGLPPAWLDCGDIELFHDEIVNYAGRLQAAGVPIVLDVVPGAPHGFEKWAADTQPARDVVRRARSWLDTALNPAQSPGG